MARMARMADQHRFSADRPISSRKEDLLGRTDFADNMAAAIRGWQGKESLVVALYGPWGSGKSSIKNMVLESLRSGEPAAPLIVEFNPWQWAGQDRLAEAFFREVGLALGRIDTGKAAEKRMAKWREYAATWNAGSYVVGGFRKLILILLATIAATGLGSGLLKGNWLNAVWTGIGLLALILFVLEWLYGVVGAFSERVASVFEARSRANMSTLEEQKEELSTLLRKMTKPILIVIDDVDRLSAVEIGLLFQLVRVNANFPNSVYLLLFQRDIVEKCLGSTPPIDGGEFLKKIVQVGFDIPRIERTRLERILFAGLNELLAHENVRKRFDQRRWENLFLGGLRSYFQTLRDVYRYLSTLDFHISAFKGVGSLEVNSVDLIALEVLRVFEPTAFERLPDAKAELTRMRDVSHDSHEEIESWKRRVESVVEAASQQSQVREILSQLFPPAEWVFGGTIYTHDFEEEWYRDLRLCHPDVFDRYFHLTIPEGDISQAELDRILSLAGDRKNLVALFRNLNGRCLLGTALDRLEAYKQEVPLVNAVPFVTALFDIGDELPEDHGGLSLLSPEAHAFRIVFWFLKQEKDVGKRGRVLQEAMRATTGLYLPIMVTSRESDKKNREKDRNTFNVADEDLEGLQGICLEKIKQAAVSGQLKAHPKMIYLLYRWREWGSPKEPQQWVEELVQSEEGALSFLAACLESSTSQRASDYTSKLNWRISLKTIESLIPIDTLTERVAKDSLNNN